MLRSIDRIHEYTAGMDQAAFVADQKTFDAVMRNLEIIGEASRYIPESLTRHYTDLPWRSIGDLRNVIIHNYNALSPDRLWLTIKESLPGLKSALVAMLASLPPDADA